MSMFEAYITNLGLYPERGVEVGEYLKFPATTEELQALLSRIEVDGRRYEEIFITDFQSDVLGLYDYMDEYESIDELNHLAHVLEEVQEQGDIEKFEAALVYGEYTHSVKDLINLAQNLDCYDFYPGVENEEDLGRYYIDEFQSLAIPGDILPYFDYEAYGRDIDLSGSGCFAPGGYVAADTGCFTEYYHGPEDIPEEHKIFAYPEEKEAAQSILQTIKEFKAAPPIPLMDKAGPHHEER